MQKHCLRKTFALACQKPFCGKNSWREPGRNSYVILIVWPFWEFIQKNLLLKLGVSKAFISNISSSEIITVIIIYQNGN